MKKENKDKTDRKHGTKGGTTSKKSRKAVPEVYLPRIDTPTRKMMASARPMVDILGDETALRRAATPPAREVEMLPSPSKSAYELFDDGESFIRYRLYAWTYGGWP